MAFCPMCKSEYREGIENCHDCQIPLVDILSLDDTIDYVELYICNSVLEAEHLKIILNDQAIDCNLRIMESSPFPLSANIGGETRLIVPLHDQDRAQKIIRGCIENQEISDKGLFL